MTATVGPKQFTGKHMLASIVAFFAVIVGVNLLMAYLASSTWSGLVVENGYVASQSFARDLAKAQAQEAMGWRVAMNHAADRVTVSFTGRGNRKLEGLTVIGQLRRPATAKLDQALTFASAGPGLYEASAALKPGVWEVDVDAADAAGETYRKTFRFFVKG